MSVVKIKIESLYKIFGTNPQMGMEHVKNGVGKDELLSKYSHVLGLQDINLNVQEKSIQVIMGLSGSGKSTLIRHINRLIEPTAGKITVEDQDVMAYNKNALRNFRRQKTAMVFQRFALMPHMTVIKNVSLGLEMQGVDPKEIVKKLKIKKREPDWVDESNHLVDRNSLINHTDIYIRQLLTATFDEMVKRNQEKTKIRKIVSTF